MRLRAEDPSWALGLLALNFRISEGETLFLFCLGFCWIGCEATESWKVAGGRVDGLILYSCSLRFAIFVISMLRDTT